MNKWITISDDSYEGIYNIRTRGMAVPGGMIVETIITGRLSCDVLVSVSSVFVPHNRITDCYGWLESQRYDTELSGNTHGENNGP